MKVSIRLLCIFTLIGTPVLAATTSTGKGKIEFTEGHISAKCRTVSFVSNADGTKKRFRISNVADSDVNAIAIAAVSTNQNVEIWYDPNVTTGCGAEPQITYIRLYSN